MTAPVQAATAQESVLAGLNAARRSAGASKEDSQNRFLTLLVTQLRNQDPLNPMDNAQVTSQLAQISTVDGIERLNRTLEALVTNSSDGQALQAAALVGRQVAVPGQVLRVFEGTGLAGIELAAPAERVRVTIKDANGLPMRSLDLGAAAAGTRLFQWDGKTDAGAAVVDGAYTFEVSATAAEQQVSATALEVGPVTGVVRDASGIGLEVGTLGMFKVADVRQIY
ncbi:MAG TPA: flagellar hook assembly protein FlgD [Rhodocyclaceae bacterium]|nr:MAG: flagellar biosynthesis protein FlgD [Betaproteobacteria bacterium CG2_30_68_42]PIV76896.1 MAG: flagellar hook assembly protein FlgD [Rhodocyclales bacterium CG17_big_fil_post_rev_8_21_14_2_50_68_7]PJA56979.1 MAG: flagellar hook assembly protein FlgD [Rhodocyclales bacterium CG_4_9_14_3_um_filter_68_10]HCX32936.1 flagellar hook assembly protein FlgD [Rhodocyclaceae bacterium]